MSATENRPAATPVQRAIRNPADPGHFMVVQPVSGRARVYLGETLVADCHEAVRVTETGKRAYDPRLYFPPAALKVPLEKLDKVTHCPLKGEADYFALDGREIGWAYRAYDFAAALDGFYSFGGDGIQTVEGD